ncbi:MAG: hypothetical protein GEV03_15040 [Streptosporangiales bacterium]|nr:hypothetical protein [Streptosporangiales bacterium]
MWLASIEWSDVDWGDAPTWITAAVTLLALVAAFTAAWATWHQLRMEQIRDDKRDQREVEQRRAAEQAEQADYVAAWIDFHEGLVVRNGSELPVYDARISVFHAGEQIGGTADLPVIPPGEQKVGIPGPEPDTWYSLGIRDRREGRADIRFRDTAGREWRRDEHGVLTKTGVRVFLGVATEEETAGKITPEVDVHPQHGTDEA